MAPVSCWWRQFQLVFLGRGFEQKVRIQIQLRPSTQKGKATKTIATAIQDTWKLAGELFSQYFNFSLFLHPCFWSRTLECSSGSGIPSTDDVLKAKISLERIKLSQTASTLSCGSNDRIRIWAGAKLIQRNRREAKILWSSVCDVSSVHTSEASKHALFPVCSWCLWISSF